MKLTGLKGRIPVEPLDDERLTNIERRIITNAAVPAPRTPRFGFAFAVATVLVVAVGAGFAGWQLHRVKPQPAPIASAEPVRVHTTAEHSILDIGDATIESDPSTEYAVTRPEGGVLVTMKRGKVELSVGKRGDRPPLVVAAGDTRVIVVGTRFSVDFGDGSGPVDVRVTEGIVRVERLQQDVRVAAGQAWTPSRGVVALAELPQHTAIAKAETPDPKTPDDNIDIETQTPDVLRDHTSAVPDAKASTKPDVPVAKKPVGPELAVRPHSGGGSGSAALDLIGLVRSQPVLPPLDVGLRPEESMSKYREIFASTKNEEASMAMYSIAVTQHQKLGRNAKSRR